MPAYKYTLKSGKTLWYANFYYTDWTGEKSISANEGSKHRGKQKIMRGPFWISRAVQATYSFLPSLQIIWKIWSIA